MRIFVRPFAVVMLCWFILGCTSDERRQATFTVSGQVLLDGKPFKGAFVAFIPKDTTAFKMEERPQATTDDEGKFKISTYLTGDGAPAGEYFVGIDSPAGDVEDDGSDQVKRTRGPRIPAKYNNPQKSGLTVTIEPKDNVLPPFQLSSK